MNAVSTCEAIGSAVKVIAAGNAIDNISRPRLSNLNTNLQYEENQGTYIKTFINNLWKKNELKK
jgi:hypothetical protein